MLLEEIFFPIDNYNINKINIFLTHLWVNSHRVSSWMEKAMAPHSSTLAWKIPWMGEPGGLPSMGLHRVRHDWVPSLSLFTFMHWRRKWHPTPVFLPGEYQRQRSLVGCRLWGCTGSGTTKAMEEIICWCISLACQIQVIFRFQSHNYYFFYLTGLCFLKIGCYITPWNDSLNCIGFKDLLQKKV